MSADILTKNKTSKTFPEVICNRCYPGSYAPTVLEFSDFEKVSSVFTQVCTPVTDHTSKEKCFGYDRRWRVELEQLSHGEGIPPGLRLGLRLRAEFLDHQSRFLNITFTNKNFKKDESFKIFVDGETKFQTSADGTNLLASVELTPGSHLLEIAVESRRSG